jgi:hypothetical protein
MSYKLKYQSDFYNVYRKLVSVKIYKKDYGSHAPILLRTSEVVIEVNWQDEKTPIIGTGVKINIINTGSFDSLEDLLTSREREFYCTIEYEGSGIVFQGFSLCDLNEQQFISRARITIQFVDYVRRLESDFAPLISGIEANTNVLALIRWALLKVLSIDFTIPLCVNSTLFESTMVNDGLTDTCLEQLWAENNAFFTNATDFDSTYVALNKLLLSLGMYMYSYGTSWYIERLEDTLRAGNWVRYSDVANGGLVNGASVASLKQEYNKQDGDFQYVEQSQLLEYASGLQKLILDLNDKQLDTFVFNKFSTSMLTVADETPDAGTLSQRIWYAHQNVTQLATGYAFRDMSSYFKWSYTPSVTTPQYKGLYYSFEVTFNHSEEVPTELSVSYKMSCEMDLNLFEAVLLRFAIRFDGGAFSDQYLGYIPGPGTSGVEFLTTSIPFLYNYQDFDVTVDKKTKTWTLSKSFDLTSARVVEILPGVKEVMPSIWNLLGNPATQKFTIMFFPVYCTGNFGGYQTSTVNYIGDIEVKITQEEILNKLTYYINEDFINSESVDIDFFDLANRNFSNGLLTGTLGANKTALWTSEQNTTQQVLMDIFAKSKYRRYYHTVHKLKSTIRFDGHLKPFAVLTDDQLWTDSSGEFKKLVLQSYSWDLNNGTYNIEAVEYTNEVVTLDLSSETLAVPSGMPTGLTAVQDGGGGHFLVQWNAVVGATGYILQRKPYWYDSTYWAQDWKVIYNGINLLFVDDIQEEGTAENEMYVYYKVLAYNASGQSLSCPEVIVQWYDA